MFRRFRSGHVFRPLYLRFRSCAVRRPWLYARLNQQYASVVGAATTMVARVTERFLLENSSFMVFGLNRIEYQEQEFPTE
ncbi:MAG: hypothetical protein ACSHX3_16785 [Litorimonas sp.]